jgi:hypothetical protein
MPAKNASCLRAVRRIVGVIQVDPHMLDLTPSQALAMPLDHTLGQREPQAVQRSALRSILKSRQCRLRTQLRLRRCLS